jgi:hypothetical protein
MEIVCFILFIVGAVGIVATMLAWTLDCYGEEKQREKETEKENNRRGL